MYSGMTRIGPAANRKLQGVFVKIETFHNPYDKLFFPPGITTANLLALLFYPALD